MINVRYSCSYATQNIQSSSSIISKSTTGRSWNQKVVLSSSKVKQKHHVKSSVFSYSSSSSSSSLSSSLSSSSNVPFQGLLGLLTNQQRSLLDEQKELSRTALHLARRVGATTTTASVGGDGGGIAMDLQQRIGASQRNPFILQHILTPNNDNDPSGRAQMDRKDSEEVLDTTFSVVVAGEFNAGKSTLINALLGKKMLETGSLPTTDTITVLTKSGDASDSTPSQMKIIDNSNNSNNTNTGYDGTITTTSHSNAITLYRIPCASAPPLLQDLSFIDTPGTNAVTNHTKRTLKLLPNADLILFVTSADRPMPDSERQLLKSIQSYRKNIVVVINKMDILDASGGNHGQFEKKKVYDFVNDNVVDLLGANVTILTVSSRDALSAKLIHSNASTSTVGQSSSSSNANDIESSKLWKRSGFGALESYLKDSLTEEAKVQAKLLNPLGVTEGMLTECLNVLEHRRRELETDIATVNLLQNQMDAWRRDMDHDINQFQQDVHDHLKREMDRCRALVDSLGFFEKYSLFLFGGSDNITKLESKWDDTKSVIVSNDLEKEIVECVRTSTDEIATNARAQGQAVIEHLGRRPASVGHNLIGSVTAASRFEDTRKDLFEKITQSLEIVLASYDAEKEKKELFQYLQNAVYLSTLFHTFSISSGVATALELLDILPGTASTLSFAALGLGIFTPTSRRMIENYEGRWQQRSKKLGSALEELCSKEIQRIHKRVLDGCGPYTRYVITERGNVETFTEECHNLLATSQTLRKRIAKLR